MKEKKDRVDDALHATKAAIEEGIVPGGGAALLYASQKLSRSKTGSAIVRKACRMPFQQILINAGYEDAEAQMLGKELVELNDTWNGYDLIKEQTINMKEAGIIDPTKVTRTALQNAASIAGTILLTECTVVDEPIEDNVQQQIDPMMGMM